MSLEIHGKDITRVVNAALRHHLETPQPDAVLSIETHMFNVTLAADSCEYSLDLGKHVWLNKSRWTRLIREYVSAEDIWRFLRQATEIYKGTARKGATANMLFKDPVRYEKKHRWGGCLMGATFRGEEGNHPTITFFSRTTYMGYMGLLDAGIAHIMAQYIAKDLDDLSGIGFRWHITSQQLHCFKTIPYIFSQKDLIKDLEKYAKKTDAWCKKHLTPTWRYMTKWYKKIQEAYEEHGVKMLNKEKYGPFRRIKRRWLEYKRYLKKNIPPSLLISNLDFNKAL